VKVQRQVAHGVNMGLDDVMDDYRHRIEKFHEQLGIPREFAAACKIPLQLEAEDLVPVGRDMFGRDQYLAPRASRHWQLMHGAALESGIELQIVSAFRSVDYQCMLIRNKLEQGLSIDEILKVNAAPGYSEHHTGAALDLGTPGCEPLSEEFEDTHAFAWLQRNAPKYEFELSYPRNNKYGIIYEPWHWAYRG